MFLENETRHQQGGTHRCEMKINGVSKAKEVELIIYRRALKRRSFPKKRWIKKEGNVYRSRMPLSYKKPNSNYLSPSILEIYIAYTEIRRRCHYYYYYIIQNIAKAFFIIITLYLKKIKKKREFFFIFSSITSSLATMQYERYFWLVLDICFISSFEL